ncbi:MAG: aldo/keto reductase [Pseudomonadota bacterium]
MRALRSADGTPISSLCFGCMQFGGTADLKASSAMYDACRAAHINFFDTAHTYTEGASERFVGDFIQNERDQIFLATKAGYTGGSSSENIAKQFDESRSRLRTDVIDVLYLHRWDPDTALEETFETLAQLQQSGSIRYIGVSNFAAWQTMKAQAVARSFETRIDMIQPMYSLVKRQAEVELFPMALAEEIVVASYSPLAAGLLTGKYQKGGTGRLTSDKRYAQRYGQNWMGHTAAGFADLAAEMSMSPATLAVAWAAHHPAVTAPIISARNVSQLEPSLAAMDVNLEPEMYSSVEALSVRPAPATDRLEEAVG